MARKRKNQTVPGTIYRNKNRWWWKVKLPGDENIRNLPLKPIGADFATSHRDVAEEIAKNMWHEAVLKADKPFGDDDPTIAALVHRYQEYAKSYYVNPDGTNTGWTAPRNLIHV